MTLEIPTSILNSIVLVLGAIASLAMAYYQMRLVKTLHSDRRVYGFFISYAVWKEFEASANAANIPESERVRRGKEITLGSICYSNGVKTTTQFSPDQILLVLNTELRKRDSDVTEISMLSAMPLTKSDVMFHQSFLAQKSLSA